MSDTLRIVLYIISLYVEFGLIWIIMDWMDKSDNTDNEDNTY